jgi:hypothetical protein
MNPFAHLGATARPGPVLLDRIQRQLLADLLFYGIDGPELHIDWSESLGEGHCTSCMDGTFEELSGVLIRGPRGLVVAEGWVDFVHGGGDNPIFAFWLFLSSSEGRKLKSEPVIPEHIWQQLPHTTRELCAEEGYDSRWSRDPLVARYRRQR